MRTRSIRLAPSLAVLFLAHTALSQTVAVVAPPRFQAAEGESFTGLPFSRSTPVRAQLWYGPSYFPRTGNLVSVALRPDGGRSFGAKVVDIEIVLATGPATPDAVAAQFSSNRGSDAVTGFKRRVVRLPAVLPAAGPRPFDVSFTLDRSFPFDPKKGGLLVELVLFGQQPGAWHLDLGTRCTSARAAFGGSGCRGSNGKAPVADSPTGALLWGRPFVVRVRDLRAMSPVAMLFGTRESGPWMGLTLPYRMDVIGAPGCTLATDAALVLGAAANSLGEARLPGQIPPVAKLVGTWIRFQGMALDPRANALGAAMSNGSKVQICGPDPMARIVATNLVSGTGAVETGVSPVARFTFQ